jgi:two-component system, response regulator, stage 0 sporulation protein F
MRGTCVLVVDDDPVIRELIARVVIHTGSRVIRAETAAQALRVLDDEPVDLVLTDLDLHEAGGGLRLLAALSARPATPPVVVVTASDDGAALRAARLLGARDVVEKPFSLDELRKGIADALHPIPAAA